jgi:hypothetical protein
MYQFAYSLITEGHLVCFEVLAIMNKAVISIHIQGFVHTLVFNSLGKQQETQLLDHMFYLVVLETTKLSSKRLNHLEFPPAMKRFPVV